MRVISSRRVVLPAVFALVAIVGACSKKEPEPTSTAPPTPTSTSTATSTPSALVASLPRACADVAAALCTKFESCNTGAMLSIVFDDLAHCVARMKLVCAVELVAPDVASTVAEVQACANAINATSCGDGFDPDSVAECRWVGARANGGACGVNAQCTSGFCDKRPPSSECGTCAALPQAGEACPAERCAPGHKCVAPGKCMKLVAIGAACDASTPCASSGYCLGKKCVAPAHLGDKCDPLGRGGPGCSEMITCDTKTKICRPPTLANVGEPCGLVGTELRACTRSWCEAHGEGGKCIARVAEGGTCTTSEACVVPATCVSGTCKMPNPAGCR